MSSFLRPPTTIVEAARLCAQSFVQLQLAAHLLQPSSESDFEDQLGRFKIWAGNLGVFAAGTASADFRLKDDQEVKDVIINMLARLTKEVEKLHRQPSLIPSLLEEPLEHNDKLELLELPGSSVSSTSSWELSSTSSTASQPERARSDPQHRCDGLTEIVDIIDRLYRLSAIVRKQTSLSEHARVNKFIERTKDSLDLEDYESYVKWQIGSWCPEATVTLVDRLSDMVMLRRKKLLYRERHQQKLNEGTEDWFVPRNPESVYQKASRVKFQDVASTKRPPARLQIRAVLSATKASSFDRQQNCEKSIARSTITKSAINRRERLDAPPPPRPQLGLEAKCPYCSKFLTKAELKKDRWIRHILNDIDPYVCLFETCDKPENCFKTVDDWLSHIQWKHTLVFSCQSTGHESELFNSSADLELHMHQQHSREFSESQLPFLVHKSLRPSPDTFGAFARARKSIGASKDSTSLCPLCLFSADEPNMPPDSISGEKKFKNIMNHIASHMESIALLSLPAAADDISSKVSHNSRLQSEEDIIERNKQDLPLAVFTDESISHMPNNEGLLGETLLGEDYMMNGEWSYILKSPNTRKPVYKRAEDDEIFRPFISRYMSERPQIPPQSYFIVPFSRNVDFVDHGDILTQIFGFCSGKATRAALVGLGGVGYEINPEFCKDQMLIVVKRKSQLALEYSYRTRDESPHTFVFWVTASNAAMFEESYRRIAEEVKLPGRDDAMADILNLVGKWLCNVANTRWIMILDGADDSALFDELGKGKVVTRAAKQPETAVSLDNFLPRNLNGSILVTSRNEDLALRLTGDVTKIIKVKLMDNSDALALLQKTVKDQFNREDAKELLEALGYLPLTIAQAAAFMNMHTPFLSIPKFLDQFRAAELNLINREGGRLLQCDKALLTTIEISLERVYHAKPSAARLLLQMSVFDCSGIPKYLLSYDRDDTDPNYLRNLDIEFEDNISTLINYSLVRTNVERSLFYMHPLVQFSTREWTQASADMEKWKEEGIRIMARTFPAGMYENWATCGALYPHAKAVLSFRPKDSNLILQWTEILLNAAWYAREQGNYGEAEEMNLQAFDATKSLLGLEHPDTLSIMKNLAMTYMRQGRWKEAEELDVQVMETSSRVLGLEHPNTLSSTANLASTYRNQGRWKEAEELEVQVMDTSSRVLGLEHPSTLSSMNNLASTYRNQGRWEEAKELFAQVVETSSRVLGLEHPDTLTNMGNLASTYRNQGRWKEAEELEVQVLETSSKVLGLEHPDTLTNMGNLASTYRNQGRWKEAEELDLQVMETSSRVLGLEHPDTLSSMANLALTFCNQGRWKEAEELEVQVMETSSRVLGPEHPDTLTNMNNLAWTFWGLDKKKEAIQLMSEVVQYREEKIGSDHPHTVQSIQDLQEWRDG